jgi:F-type H+-transporting ATPase subunit delta
LIKLRVAKRYARALFELAKETGRIEEIGGELTSVVQFFETNGELWHGLTSPATPREAKSQALDAIAEKGGLDKTVANFLRVLLDARKMVLLPQVTSAYADLADEAAGRVRGTAAAPMKLDEAALQRLSAALSKALSKKVVLDAEQDPSLVGGVVARVGNLVFDASVKTQLERMKDSLIKG